MKPVLDAWLDRLEHLHSDFRAEIAGRSIEDLDWRPGQETNSLAVIAAHVAGSERFWIGDIVMGEPSGRDRDSEFEVQGVSADILLGRLERALDYSRIALGKVRVDQLGEPRPTPEGDRTVSVAWAITHVVEHTALHLGHAQVTGSLLGRSR
jgi:uncharacterized damage-inducible protein DinB